MNEIHLPVRRTARVVTIGERTGLVRDLWIVCHGYGQLARIFARPFEAVAREDRLIVAPEALNRYYLDAAPQQRGPDARVGATWMTREDRDAEINDYVTYLDQTVDWALEPTHRARVRLTILGFSQAVATVGRWVVLGRTQPDRLILWAGALPEDVDSARVARALEGVDVVLVAGDADQYVTPERFDAAEKALRKLTQRIEVIRFSGAHVIDPAVLAAIAK